MTTRKERRTKKKEEAKLPEYPIKISYSCFTEITREADPEEKFSGEESRSDYSFDGTFSLAKTSYFDFVLHEPPVADKKYYLVYVRYSTGDSFNRRDGELCMVEFLDEYEDAIALRNAIQKDYDKYDRHGYNPSAYSFKMTLPKSGRELTVSTGTWKGYFEVMESVDFETLTLNENA